MKRTSHAISHLEIFVVFMTIDFETECKRFFTRQWKKANFSYKNQPLPRRDNTRKSIHPLVGTDAGGLICVAGVGRPLASAGLNGAGVL
jgi:hypothetical protein